jgi:hypothetical protein
MPRAASDLRVYSDRTASRFGIQALLSSALKIDAVCSSETLVSVYKFTRCYNPEEQHRHLHSRGNLRSRCLQTQSDDRSPPNHLSKSAQPLEQVRPITWASPPNHLSTQCHIRVLKSPVFYSGNSGFGSRHERRLSSFFFLFFSIPPRNDCWTIRSGRGLL